MSASLVARQTRARARMAELGIDVLLLSVGADLPYLTGYEAMPLERLTMLVLPRNGEATLVVPELEAPRVDRAGGGFELRAWSETEDPVAIVAGLVPSAAGTIAIGDQTWARFVLALQVACADRVGRNRAVERGIGGDLVAADGEGCRRDRSAAASRARRRPRCRQDAGLELLGPDRGRDPTRHRRPDARAGSSAAPTSRSSGPGPTARALHHDAGERLVSEGDVVVCDFGGTMQGYCSDITRMFSVGEPTSEVQDVYGALFEAQELAVQAATVGTPCEEVDAVARRALGTAGLAEHFVHRVGHGIGLDAHEDPYLVSGNAGALEPGHAFSIEPGVYFQGRYGMRLEDIVVATEAGPDRLNLADRDLAVVS